ncbi:MAG: hydroxyacylglutathione hydrolase [Burkholderiales bacterium PBB5]|nr:MAG: hydroxyacylglutathione hydrolase [Burkholderiales bacterium PBB5]
MNLVALPAFSDNYIWMLHDDRQAIVVDPGVAAPVLAALDARGLALGAILVTHHHPDHVGGLAGLRGRGQAPLLFCGDTLFSGGCGRLFEGTPAQMHQSLGRLAALPGNTRVCCAHEYTESNLRFAQAVEPANAALADYTTTCRQLRANGQPTLPSSIATELAVNPFMRCDAPDVISAARAQGAADSSGAAVLGALREWKNGFR